MFPATIGDGPEACPARASSLSPPPGGLHPLALGRPPGTATGALLQRRERLFVRGDKEKTMKHHKLILAACATVGIGLGATPAQAADISVNLGRVSIDLAFGSPPQRYEPVPPPRHGHVWMPGYWRATGRHHEWVAGNWIRAQHDHAWSAAHRVTLGQGWHHAGSAWRQRAVHPHAHHH